MADAAPFRPICISGRRRRVTTRGHEPPWAWPCVDANMGADRAGAIFGPGGVVWAEGSYGGSYTVTRDQVMLADRLLFKVAEVVLFPSKPCARPHRPRASPTRLTWASPSARGRRVGDLRCLIARGSSPAPTREARNPPNSSRRTIGRGPRASARRRDRTRGEHVHWTIASQFVTGNHGRGGRRRPSLSHNALNELTPKQRRCNIKVRLASRTGHRADLVRPSRA